jgi:hypothetical protein
MLPDYPPCFDLRVFGGTFIMVCNKKFAALLRQTLLTDIGLFREQLRKVMADRNMKQDHEHYSVRNFHGTLTVIFDANFAENLLDNFAHQPPPSVESFANLLEEAVLKEPVC